MRTALIAIAAAWLLALAAWWYHHSTVSDLTEQLQTEIGAHAVTQGKLTACLSSSRAACAVQAAKDGKADAGHLLRNLIKERKK